MAITPSLRQAPAAPGQLAVKRRFGLFWVLFALTIVLVVILNAVDIPLRTPAAARGIISYELAVDVEHGQAMIDSWSPLARNYAAFQLGLDYLFMPAYALTIALGCLWAAPGLGARVRRLGDLGRVLAAGLVPAVLLDATENFALMHMLLAGAASEPWRGLAFACAAVKFLLIIGSLLFLIAGVVSWLAARFFGR